ncbi:MAG: hypothetical protein KJ601_06535 [Nanoarchaeota archaeon]|nr:hypothetical protein [Nanoarchaeota archaeon]MBU1704283.1 hypothetical protein [Nanoarchaeota archaeon]
MEYTREQFDTILDKSRQILADKSLDDCPCTQNCEWHGKCFECVKIHRVKGKHIPECLQHIFQDKFEALANCIERKTADDRPVVK